MSSASNRDARVLFVSETTRISTRQAEGAITLFDDGATVPFIARYRKEKTGQLAAQNHRASCNEALGYRLRSLDLLNKNSDRDYYQG